MTIKLLSFRGKFATNWNTINEIHVILYSDFNIQDYLSGMRVRIHGKGLHNFDQPFFQHYILTQIFEGSFYL
jgi:hypothetical protein